MDIYIIVYREEGYLSKELHRSYNDKEHARLQAIEYASNKKFTLDKILEVNTGNKKVTEYKLAVENDRIVLRERKITNA